MPTRPVVGVDISAEMIRLDRQREAAEPLGIAYHVADLPVLGLFGLATAVYLFNYAPDRRTMRAMFHRIRENLAPRGRLLAVIPNPAAYPDGNWERIGSRVLGRDPGGEAPVLRVEFLTDPPTPFSYYEWQLQRNSGRQVHPGHHPPQPHTAPRRRDH